MLDHTTTIPAATPPLTRHQKGAATKKAKRAQAHAAKYAQIRQTAAAPNAPVRALPLDHLVIEHDFQAPLQQKRVDNIVQKYDPLLYAPITVARIADECYSILDGQHRYEAAKQLGFVAVACEILGGLAYAERARVFRERNLFRRTPDFGVLFRSMVEQQVPDALVIVALLASYGLSLDYTHSAGPEAAGTIRAVRTVYNLYRVGGTLGLQQVIGTLHEAYGLDQAAYSTYLLWGLRSFYYRYADQAIHTRLIKVLQDATVVGIWSTAAELGPSLQREKATGIAIAIHYLYNYKLQRGQRLPDFVLGKGKR